VVKRPTGHKLREEGNPKNLEKRRTRDFRGKGIREEAYLRISKTEAGRGKPLTKPAAGGGRTIEREGALVSCRKEKNKGEGGK